MHSCMHCTYIEHDAIPCQVPSVQHAHKQRCVCGSLVATGASIHGVGTVFGVVAGSSAFIRALSEKRCVSAVGCSLQNAHAEEYYGAGNAERAAAAMRERSRRRLFVCFHLRITA